jgi:hypothetical protein
MIGAIYNRLARTNLTVSSAAAGKSRLSPRTSARAASHPGIPLEIVDTLCSMIVASNVHAGSKMAINKTFVKQVFYMFYINKNDV